MEVILICDVKGLGKKSEKVNVSDGYARNFLFPRGLAAEANAQTLSEMKTNSLLSSLKLMRSLKQLSLVQKKSTIILLFLKQRAALTVNSLVLLLRKKLQQLFQISLMLKLIKEKLLLTILKHLVLIMLRFVFMQRLLHPLKCRQWKNNKGFLYLKSFQRG